MKRLVLIVGVLAGLGWASVAAAPPMVTPTITVENVSFPGDALHYGDTIRVVVANPPQKLWNTVLGVNAPLDQWIVNGSPFGVPYTGGYADQADNRDAAALFVLGTASTRNEGQGECLCNYSGEWTGTDAYLSIFVMGNHQVERYAEVYGIPVFGAR